MLELKDCTKHELIYIIDQLTANHFFSPERYINPILIDIVGKRSEAILQEQKNWLKLYNESLKKRDELLKPYMGRKVSEIPNKIIEQAAEYEKTAAHYWKMYRKCDRDYNRCMELLSTEDET